MLDFFVLEEGTDALDQNSPHREVSKRKQRDDPGNFAFINLQAIVLVSNLICLYFSSFRS